MDAEAKLAGARFRWLNEQLYKAHGNEALRMFQDQPDLFEAYHKGFEAQAALWPLKPVDHIAAQLLATRQRLRVADLGCGRADLAVHLAGVHDVRSFDLVAAHSGVEAADMAALPLADASIDVAVCCLALMAADVSSHVAEAARVVRSGGLFLIAEVSSRFDADAADFARRVEMHGFRLLSCETPNAHFTFFTFKRRKGPAVGLADRPAIVLKPCVYKRR